jgi:phosphatidate cytidylyltransferase
MLLLGAGIVVAEAFGIRAVRIAAVAIVAVMIFEYIRAIVIAPRKNTSGTANILTLSAIGALLLLMLASAWFVGGRPWIILLLLLTISCADIGAWFFGQLFGNDKMWERLSPGKTWAGQIAGILCGTAASIMYGLLGSDTFFPQLLWIGISVSLLSQYGDLTASWIKRKLNIKDFGHILPGHGGVMDRFDGWIYVLPIIWLVML